MGTWTNCDEEKINIKRQKENKQQKIWVTREWVFMCGKQSALWHTHTHKTQKVNGALLQFDRKSGIRLSCTTIYNGTNAKMMIANKFRPKKLFRVKCDAMQWTNTNKMVMKISATSYSIWHHSSTSRRCRRTPYSPARLAHWRNAFQLVFIRLLLLIASLS